MILISILMWIYRVIAAIAITFGIAKLGLDKFLYAFPDERQITTSVKLIIFGVLFYIMALGYQYGFNEFGLTALFAVIFGIVLLFGSVIFIASSFIIKIKEKGGTTYGNTK